MNASISQRDLETLSAYLDGELKPAQIRNIEARLSSEQALRAALEDLRNTRSALRLAPRLRAPRNFTLTPEMAGVRQTTPRLFNAMRLVSAVASFLFVITVAGDYLANNPVMIGGFAAPEAEMPAMQSMAFDDAESNTVEEQAERMDKAAEEMAPTGAPADMPLAEMEPQMELAPEEEFAEEEAASVQAEGLGGGSGEGDFDPSGDSMPGGGGGGDMGGSDAGETYLLQPTMTIPPAIPTITSELEEERSMPDAVDETRIIETEQADAITLVRVFEWSLGLIALGSAIIAFGTKKKSRK